MKTTVVWVEITTVKAWSARSRRDVLAILHVSLFLSRSYSRNMVRRHVVSRRLGYLPSQELVFFSLVPGSQ